MWRSPQHSVHVFQNVAEDIKLRGYYMIPPKFDLQNVLEVIAFNKISKLVYSNRRSWVALLFTLLGTCSRSGFLPPLKDCHLSYPCEVSTLVIPEPADSRNNRTLAILEHSAMRGKRLSVMYHSIELLKLCFLPKRHRQVSKNFSATSVELKKVKAIHFWALHCK